MDVQNQLAWPSGKRAKFSGGPCNNQDTGFNFDPQVIAVAEEIFFASPRLSRLNISAREFSFVAVTEVSASPWVRVARASRNPVIPQFQT